MKNEFTKSASMSVRLEPELKAEAEKVFKEIGLSNSEAVAMFLERVSQYGRLPFSVDT